LFEIASCPFAGCCTYCGNETRGEIFAFPYAFPFAKAESKSFQPVGRQTSVSIWAYTGGALQCRSKKFCFGRYQLRNDARATLKAMQGVEKQVHYDASRSKNSAISWLCRRQSGAGLEATNWFSGEHRYAKHFALDKESCVKYTTIDLIKLFKT
jgi:hypothetical protein